MGPATIPVVVSAQGLRRYLRESTFFSADLSGASFLFANLPGATTFLGNFTNAYWTDSTSPDVQTASTKPNGDCF